MKRWSQAMQRTLLPIMLSAICTRQPHAGQAMN